MKKFEDFLKEKHGEEYIGTDDDMPEAFDAWLTELTPDEMISFGDQFGELKMDEASAEMQSLRGEENAHEPD